MKYKQTFREALEEVRQVKEDGHTDVASAVRQCKTAIEDASQMLSKLQGMSPEGDLPSWWMNKIAIAANSMNKLRDYLLVPSTNEQKEEVEPQSNEKDPTDEINRLKAEIQMLKTKLENEKNRASKPEPNPETGEIPLRTGLAQAILKVKDEAEQNQNKSKQTSKMIKSLGKESFNPLLESDASDKAKGLGLDYMSFGRYGKDGKVTHKSIGGSLTAVDKDEKPIKEPKSAKPKDEPKKSAPADDDEIKLKSKNFLRDLEKGNLEDDDGMIEIDMDDDGQGAMAASELAAKQGLTDLASDLEDVASSIADYEPDEAQALMQDIEAKYSGGEVESVVQSQKADKAIDLLNDQDYDQETYSNFITDLTSTFDIVRKMVDSDDTEGNAGSGMRNSAKGFRPEVLDTIKSLDDIQSKVAEMRDDIEDEKIKDKLQEIADEIEFCVDDNADHDNYTKSHKVNGSIEAIQDILKDLAGSKNESFARLERFKKRYIHEQESEEPLTDKDLLKKTELKDIIKTIPKKKLKLDNKKTKIEVNPDVEIGVFSGGKQTTNGNLH